MNAAICMRVKHPDLYQLLAYLVSTGLGQGVLIYAKGEDEPATHHVVNLGRRLDVVAIDLEADADDLLAQIGRVADRLLAAAEGTPTTIAG